MKTGEKPLLLHIETATPVCSAAISSGAEVVEMEETSTGLRHSSSLVPFIDTVIKRAGIGFRDLDAVSVSVGPGSYTGLRVGLATAKGICFGADVPLIGIDTLESLAIAAASRWKGADRYLPMIDARRMEVYTAQFDRSGARFSDDIALKVDGNSFRELLDRDFRCLFFGDGAHKCVDVISARNMEFRQLHCSAAHLAGPAEVAYRENRFANTLYITPKYLKPPNITKPAKPRF